MSSRGGRGGRGGSAPQNSKERRRAAIYQSPDIHTVIEGVTPRQLNVIEYAESRSAELGRLVSLISSKDEEGGGRRVFQSLPRHMRRRAMSHNLHRLPAKYRAAARKEIEKGMTSKSGEANDALTNHRKKRRRPTNQLVSHALRQAKHTWLETHLWMAKRMKMANCWGWKLPTHCTEKNVRSTHKSNLHLATIFDASFISAIKITGTQQSIIDLIRQFASPDSTYVGSAQYLDGSREGSTLIHYPGMFPRGLIGPATFHWRPVDQSHSPSSTEASSSTSQQELWLWIHAAVFDETLHLLTEASSVSHCAIESLQGQLNRFELTGARCQSVVATALKPVTSPSSTTTKGTQLWSLLCNSDLRTPASLPSSVILSIEAVHPELRTGRNGIKQPFTVHHDNTSSSASTTTSSASSSSSALIDSLLHWPNDVASSPLFDDSARSELTSSCAWGKKRDRHIQRTEVKLATKAAEATSETVVDEEMKSETTTSSTKKSPPAKRIAQPAMKSDVDVSCHAILIQRPHCPHSSTDRAQEQQRGIGSGWDVIVPAGWGVMVWRALVHAGARAIGLNDRRRFTNEQGGLSFPEDFPDSAAGYLYEHYAGQNDAASWLRHPVDKRVNYAINAIDSPWQPNWPKLVGVTDALPASLPSPALFQASLSDAICCNARSTESIKASVQSEDATSAEGPSRKRAKIDSEAVDNSMIHETTDGQEEPINSTSSVVSAVLPYHVQRSGQLDFSTCPNALFAVSIEVLTRGIIDNRAHIYCPTAEDIQLMRSSHSPDASNSSSNHVDLKGRWQGFDEPSHSTNAKPIESARQLIGFVTTGSLSLLHARGEGVGYAVSNGLSEAMELSTRYLSSRRCYVLVRVTSSRSYRPAILTIR